MSSSDESEDGAARPVVVIFSSQSCPHCAAAKVLLKQLDVCLTEIDIGRKAEERSTLSSYTHMSSVPQIFVGSLFVGGNDRLQSLHRSKELKEMIASDDALMFPEWLQDLIDQCCDSYTPQAAAEDVERRLAAVEDAAPSRAIEFALGVLGRTKQSSSTYREPAKVGPYMGACTTVHALRDAFMGCGCTRPRSDEYIALLLHSGLAYSLNSSVTTSSSSEKTWPIALHDAMRDFFLRSYFREASTQPAGSSAAAAASASGGSAATGTGAQGQRFAAAQRVAATKPSANNMIQHHLGLNASWESHLMSAASTSADDVPSPSSPPHLDNAAGVPYLCSEEVERANEIASIYADALDGVMSNIQPLHGGSGQGYMYAGLTASHSWRVYLRAAAMLRHCCVLSLDTNARKALFLNVYNGLMIHGMIHWGAPSTDRGRWKFFGRANYLIGGLSYSLDDVEHGVLRCNAPHPYKLQSQFSSEDARCGAALLTLDPRVHFAMVCGAKSCPPVRVFRAPSVEQELHEAATTFCSDPGNVEVDAEKRTLAVSRILYWFSKDFGRGAAGDVAFNYIQQYAEGEVGRALGAQPSGAASAGASGWFSSGNARTNGWKVSFKEYDWSLNGRGLMKAT